MLNTLTTNSFSMETTVKLRKKSFTLVEQAIHQVRDFRNLYQELDDKIEVGGTIPSKITPKKLKPHLIGMLN